MAEIYLKKYGKTLIPADEQSIEIFNKLPQGKVMRCEYKFPRNYKFHKKYFSMLSVMFDMQEHFTNFEEFRFWLTLKSGYYEMIKAPNGYELFRPKSIAFSKMQNDEFEKLYNDTINTFIREFPHITKLELERVLEYAE